MKPLRALFLGCLLATAAISLPVGCQQMTTIEAGGVYSDPVLAKADQAVLDSSRAMTAFIDWARTNSVFLARWPEVGQLAKNIETQRDGWIRDAYAARDLYASAAKDYRKAVADGVIGALPPNRAKLDGAIAVLTSVVTQVIAYQQAHKP